MELTIWAIYAHFRCWLLISDPQLNKGQWKIEIWWFMMPKPVEAENPQNYNFYQFQSRKYFRLERQCFLGVTTYSDSDEEIRGLWHAATAIPSRHLVPSLFGLANALNCPQACHAWDILRAFQYWIFDENILLLILLDCLGAVGTKVVWWF